MFEYLLNVLNTTPSGHLSDPCWFPALTVLSRMKPSLVAADLASLRCDLYIRAILRHLNNPVAHLRDLAAHALPAFVPVARSASLATALLSSVTVTMQSNSMHGVLLAVDALLTEVLGEVDSFALDDWVAASKVLRSLLWLSEPVIAPTPTPTTAPATTTPSTALSRRVACPATRGLYLTLCDRFTIVASSRLPASTLWSDTPMAVSRCPTLTAPTIAAPTALSTVLPGWPEYLTHACECFARRVAGGHLKEDAAAAIAALLPSPSPAVAAASVVHQITSLTACLTTLGNATNRDAIAAVLSSPSNSSLVLVLWDLIARDPGITIDDAWLAAASLLLSAGQRHPGGATRGAHGALARHLMQLTRHRNARIAEAAVSLLGCVGDEIAAENMTEEWLAVLGEWTRPESPSNVQMAVVQSLAIAIRNNTASSGTAADTLLDHPHDRVRVVALLATYVQAEDEDVRMRAACVVGSLCGVAVPPSPRAALSLCFASLEQLALKALRQVLLVLFGHLQGATPPASAATICNSTANDAETLFPREVPNAYTEPSLLAHLSLHTLIRIAYGKSNVGLMHVVGNARSQMTDDATCDADMGGDEHQFLGPLFADHAASAVCAEIAMDHGRAACGELLVLLPHLSASDINAPSRDAVQYAYHLLLTLAGAVVLWQAADGPVRSAYDEPPVFAVIPGMSQLLVHFEPPGLCAPLLQHTGAMLARACSIAIPTPSSIIKQYTAMTAVMAASYARVANGGAGMDDESAALLALLQASASEMLLQGNESDGEEDEDDGGDGGDGGDGESYGEEEKAQLEQQEPLGMPYSFNSVWLTTLVPTVDV